MAFSFNPLCLSCSFDKVPTESEIVRFRLRQRTFFPVTAIACISFFLFINYMTALDLMMTKPGPSLNEAVVCFLGLFAELFTATGLVLSSCLSVKSWLGTYTLSQEKCAQMLTLCQFPAIELYRQKVLSQGRQFHEDELNMLNREARKISNQQACKTLYS